MKPYVKLSRLIDSITAGENERITEVARRAMMALVEQYRLLQDQILDLDRQVLAWHRSSNVSKRIPGIGLLTASTLVASVGDASQFKKGISFAAFIGFPKKSSNVGKERLGKIQSAIASQSQKRQDNKRTHLGALHEVGNA